MTYHITLVYRLYIDFIKLIGEYMPKYIDISGQKFGSWTVIDRCNGYYQRKKSAYFNCICDCDRNIQHIIYGQNLRKGVSTCCMKCATSKRTKEKSFKWKGCGDISHTFLYSARGNAKRRNLEFNITIKDMWNLFLKQNRKCAISNVELNFQSKCSVCDGNASLDRIDSKRGYTIDNVQWIHKDIQKMKWDMSEDKFFDWCNIISKNHPRSV